MLRKLHSLRGSLQIICLAAIPGGGKGTLGKNLKAILGSRIAVITMSEVLSKRRMVYDALGKTLALEYKKSLNGDLVSDEPTMEALEEEVLKLHEAGIRQILLDGAIRTKPQAKALIRTGIPITTLHLSTPDQVAIERIQKRAIEEGRLDDANPKTIVRRLAKFRSETKPAIKALRDHNPSKFHHVHTTKGERGVVIEALRAMSYGGQGLYTLTASLDRHLKNKKADAALKTLPWKEIPPQESRPMATA